MVQWDWKCRCGEIHTDTGKIYLYTGGNCMCVLLTKNKSSMAALEGEYLFLDYWQDVKRLKSIIANNFYGCYPEIKKVRLNTAFLPDEWHKVAKLFTEAGVKVELYHKPAKKKH